MKNSVIVSSPRVPFVPRWTTIACRSRPASRSCSTIGTIVCICRLTAASTRCPARSSSSAAPSITESPMATIGSAAAASSVVGDGAVVGGDRRRGDGRHACVAPGVGRSRRRSASRSVVPVAGSGSRSSASSSRSPRSVRRAVGLVERLLDLVLLELGGRQVRRRRTPTARRRTAPAAGDHPARRRVARRLQPPPPAPDPAAPDRRLDEPVRDLGDRRTVSTIADDELDDRQRRARPRRG